jgi:hypothetical protein
MAVGTDWNKVIDWVDIVLPAHLREWLDVVDMDKIPSQFSIDRLERESTNLAGRPMVCKASQTLRRVSLISINQHRELFRKARLSTSGRCAVLADCPI